MCDLLQTRVFEYMDEDWIDPELICSICTDPFIDPVVIPFCNHVFCRSGIEATLRNNPTCPLCRHKPLSCDKLKPANSTVLNSLNQLLVKCVWCHQTNIKRGVFDEHVRTSCPKVTLTCSAADLNCRWTGPRDQFTLHQTHCTFELMRPFLGQFIDMRKRLEQVQLDNQELKLLVNGLDHRCKQLEKKSKGSYTIPLRSAEIPIHAKWSTDGLVVAGGNGNGNEYNQLYRPQGLYFDGSQTFYIADCFNHRIIQWKFGETNGKIVAGGNGRGNRNNQLNSPTDVVLDKESGCLIICDRENRRIVRWSLRNSRSGETIIADIDCNCLTMDSNRSLYVSDIGKNDVKRCKLGKTQWTVVAGGNGQGSRFDQLDYPTFIFVDRDYSVYVSDYNNHRVMKWMKNAEEGIVVAGGRDAVNPLTQSSYPGGVIVDQWGTVYVADSGSHRVMRWSKGAKEGKVIAGGNGRGAQPNQLNRPAGLLFDQRGNLYVADYENHRVQKFQIDTDAL